MPALVVLTPPAAPLAGGSEGVITARVRNTGAVVDQFRLEVLGPAAQWAVVEPGEISLFPGADGEVRITLRPPLGPEVPAGPAVVGVLTRSAADGSTSVEETSVVVAPAVVLAARIVPRRSRGASGAKHRLTLRNTGNAATTVALAASDPDEALSLRVTPKTLNLPPGGQVEARVKLRPRSRAWAGGAEPREFSVSVVPDGAPPQSVQATFVQMPTVRGWMIAGLLAAAVIVGAVLVITHARTAIDSHAVSAGSQNGSASTSTSTGTGTGTATASSTSTGTATGTGSSTGSSSSSASSSSGGPPPTRLSSGSVTSSSTTVHTTSSTPPTATPWPAPPASLYAVVNSDGSVARQAGVVCNPCGGGGQYDVQFNRDVSQCSWTAVPSDSGMVDATVSSDDSNTPSIVRVQIKKPYGVAAGGFTLNVVCDTGASQWVVVGYHADRQRGTATQVQHVGTGLYAVTFPTTVSGCAYIVTNGDPGGQPYVYSPAVVLAWAGSASNQVMVEFHDPGNSGAAVDNPQYAPASAPDSTALYPFHLQVFCNPGAYWMRVAPPQSAAGSQGASVGARRAAGTFDLGFNRDVSSCAWMAAGGQGAGSGHVATMMGPGGPRVVISDDSGNGVDLPFSFVALC